LRSQLGHAVEVRVETERAFERTRQDLESRNAVLGQAQRVLALTALEKARVIDGSRNVWRTIVSSVAHAVDELLAWRPWRAGNDFGNLVNRLRGRSQVDLPRELRAACVEFEEVARSPMDDPAAWIQKQSVALATLGERIGQVVESKRYHSGRTLGRLLNILRLRYPRAEPASTLGAAVQLAGSALGCMASSLVPPADSSATSPLASSGRQRFLDAIDIVVELSDVGAEERTNLQKIIEATSPPYHLWLLAPAGLQDTAWLAGFAASQMGTLLWREVGKHPRDLIERLRHSSSAAVAFVSASAPLADGWLDDALFALHAAEDRDAVPVQAGGEDSVRSAAPGLPHGVLVRKHAIETFRCVEATEGP
jgi:hypothetical protein